MAIIRYNLGPMDNNSYLIVDDATQEAAMVDPSFDSESLIPEIREAGYKLKYLLNTHAHFDHVIGNKVYAEEFGIPLALPRLSTACASPAAPVWCSPTWAAARRRCMCGCAGRDNRGQAPLMNRLPAWGDRHGAFSSDVPVRVFVGGRTPSRSRQSHSDLLLGNVASIRAESRIAATRSTPFRRE